MAGGNSAIIDLRNVSKAFAKQSGEPLPVLNDIDVSIQAGEIFGLLGRSGYGKSTWLRIAGGLVRQTAGEARSSIAVGHQIGPTFARWRTDRTGRVLPCRDWPPFDERVRYRTQKVAAD